MLFPKNRLSLTKTYQGNTDPEGWIVLDLSAIELEGVRKVYLSVRDIQKVQEKGEITTNRLQQARTLLGGDWDSEKEPES